MSTPCTGPIPRERGIAGPTASQGARCPRLPLDAPSRPTLGVRETRDPIVSQRWAEEVTGSLPQGRLVIIPRARHTLNASTPAAFLQVLRPFRADAENARTTGGFGGR